jgi:ribonuclease BN (tRNA processing enzyme)
MRQENGGLMQLTVIGCGDAFGSGGRLQTSYHVRAGEQQFLIDCGATALIGLERAGLDAGAVAVIYLTHLHGDHFAGLVWWLLHAQHIVKRTEPLTIAGPAGTEARVAAAAEALFPGSSRAERQFPVIFLEYREREPIDIGGVRVTPFEVSHPSGAPPYALRFETAGRTLTFTGDTEWVEAIVAASDGADLLIAECFAYDGPVRYHTSWEKLSANLPRITARRVMLTHMSHAMLERQGEIHEPRIMFAEDGLALDV